MSEIRPRSSRTREIVQPTSQEEAVFQVDRFSDARKRVEQTRVGGGALWKAAAALLEAQIAAGRFFAADPDYHPGNNAKIRSHSESDLILPAQQVIWRWQRAAAAAHLQEKYLDELRADYTEEAARLHIPTQIGLIRFAAAAQHRATATTPALPDGTYRAIVIDPPWPVQKIERDVRPNQHSGLDYPTMSLHEIAELPVAELASVTGAHLYLWTTHRQLRMALEIAESWGFTYQCLLTWVKTNGGMTPYSWMYDTEHVIFARRGSLDLNRLGLRLSMTERSGRHSAKPDVFYDRVLAASPEPRLEMFARRSRDGFTPWGDEAP